MIYISDKHHKKIDLKPDYLEQIIRKMKSKKNKNVDYHLHLSSTGYCIVGVINQKKTNCIIDLNNYNVNTKDFFNWLKEVLSKYENYYCMPNKDGEMIWRAFRLNSTDVFLKFTPLKLFRSTLKLRYFKFIYFNMFFTITTTKGLLKLNNRLLFYKKEIPDLIELDTF
jgi:hypothetical protein